MKLCLLILCSLAAYGVLGADPYTCAGTQTINPPADTSVLWNYPNTWNDTLPAPQYVPNQNCTWNINVPKGMYARLEVKSDSNKTSVLSLTDSTGQVETIVTANNELWFLLDPSFKVELQANQGGFLGMSVLWIRVNTTAITPNSYQVHKSSSPLALFGGDFDNSAVIQADTQVNLLVSPPLGAQLQFMPFMRVTQVYDGDSINAKLIGNLYQIYQSGKNFVSTGKSLTLFSLFPGFRTQNLNIFQDFADVKQFKSYQSVYCVMPNLCQTVLNATNGPAAAIRYWPTFYVTYAGLQVNNKLSVYNGYVGNNQKLADYTQTTTKTNLPQKFNGKFTLFVLDQGSATVQYSGDSVDSRWQVGFDNRTGFMTSPNYGMQSTDQAFGDQIYSSSTSDISYFFDSTVLIGDATLNVVIMDGQKAALNDTYQPNGVATSGAYVSFKFEHHNSAVSHGILLTVVVAVWRVLSV